MLIVFVHLCSGKKLYCTLFMQNFAYYSKCCSAISKWSTLLESIPADHRSIHCYQLLHFAVVHGLVITVRSGSSLDQNPVIPAVSLKLPTPSNWLKSAWNAWKTRFRQSIFQNFLGEGDRLRGLHPSLVGKARQCPPNRFNPVRLCS